MDAEGATRYPEAESFWHVSQKSGDLDHRMRDGESWRTVHVFLSGGAPWGFTLRGGLEHREPLLITKVEEGSKAAAVSLQVGDELIYINEVPLSGYRQEAICLVKGSHKTLSLVVKRNLKMVDIVAQKMPSENDVHVARSFLTKILRSSMRKNGFEGRNEPISRPHSWHSTKFNESQSEAGRRQSPPTAVWHPRYDASSSTTDLSSGWEQTNLRRVSDQFSSLGSMDSLEHGHMSPAKSNNSMEHLGGGKRDSAYSSFSTSSSTPDYSLSKSNAASTENVAYKVGQWDAGAKHSNGRNSQSLAAEGSRQDERLSYFQIPGVNSGHSGPQTEDLPGSRHSSSSRTSFGPVWNVPEKKKNVSASPPPPLPPARSDSFAATKAHEKGMVKTHPEGPDSHLACKVSTENRCSHNISPKNESEHVYVASDKYSHTQFSPNKQYFPFSSDVGQQVPHFGQLFHPRQHSDKSTFHPQPWSVSVPKSQNVGGYHCSSQEPPTNGSGQHSSQNQRQSRSSSLSSTTADQTTETTGPSRYYCVTTSNQPNASSWSDIPNDRRSGLGVDPAQAGTGTKVKYHLPQQHQHSSHNKDSSAYSKHQVTTVPETSVLKHFSDDRESHRGHSTQIVDPLYVSNLPKRQPEQRRSLPAQLKDSHQDIRLQTQVSNKICSQTTPMLHSLSMDVEGQEEKTSAPNSEEYLESNQVKRSERFATTLRNEIQMRRAKLQKSKSAAALPGVEGEAEDQNSWKSTDISTPTSADGSLRSNCYKDHLKEAQTRVLKATSFRRRDLEPVLMEHAAAEAPASADNYQSSAQARKDVNPLAVVTEPETNHSTGHITRIGSRKRFPTERKVRSYSEPDKIYEVGVNKIPAPTENANSSLDQQKLLNETMKPRFPDYTPAKSQLKYQGIDQTSNCAKENTKKEIKSTKVSYSSPSSQDKQRLGTFAEYEASWKIQRQHSEKKASGRYHSADNILDPGSEDRTQRTCFHERSRSSPSADIYGQKIPVPETKSNTEYSKTKSEPAQTLVTDIRFSSSSPGDCKVGDKPAEIENYSAPPPPLMTGANPDCRQRSTAAATKNHKSKPIFPSPTEPGERSHIEPPSGPGRKPSPTKHQEINFTSSQSDILIQCSSNFEPNLTFYPTTSAKTDSEQGKGRVDKGQGAVHHPSTSNPQPASSPPASSYRPSGLFSMEGLRSPSPQFSPQRLSDKPPVSLHEEESNRVEHLIESQNTAVRKVPIRIVHSEGSEEKENSPFLQQSDLPHSEAEGQSVARFGALPALGQDSVFCAFTRQREPETTPDTEMQQAAQRDPYMTTVGDHLSSNPEEPSSKTETTELSEDEDQKREELARDIMGKDKSLVDILDQSKMRTTMDLMEGLFPQGEQLLDGAHQRRKVQTKQINSRPVEEREKEDNMAVAVTMVTSSTYYSTSAPKAELLIKMKDMQEQDEEEDSEDELDIGLNNKKQELIDSLSKKLQVLREAKESLLEDILDNNALGDEVEARVQQVCRPNELEKFRMFVGDLDKVVSLLLSLSGRLARVENALNNLEEDATPEERRTLIEKRKLLIRQHEDAKELKENLDRREGVVCDILANYLPEDSLADYEHFVKMKSALIIEQRKLEDKIKLGEEQLKCLIDSLPIEQRLAM
ncbi:protein Shroom2 isoform 2-T3 [Anableps anableps]